MFCGKCGRANPDTGAYCAGCGSPLHRPATAVPAGVRPTAVAAPPVKPLDPREKFARDFRDQWRQLVRSPFMVILLLLHTVSVIIDIAQAGDLLDTLGGFMYALEEMGLDMGESPLDTITWGMIIFMAPNILIMAGMWMQFIESFRNSLHPISTTGISLIRGVTIFLVVVMVIFFCVSVLGTCSASAELAEEDSLYTSVDEELQSILDAFTIALILAAGLVFAYYAKLLKLLVSARNAGDTDFPDSDHASALAAWQFVMGGLAVIGLIANMGSADSSMELLGLEAEYASTDLTFSTLMKTVMPFLYGAALIQYKNRMESLEYVYYHTDFKRGGMTKSSASDFSMEKVPAWKRVELIRKKEDACFSKPESLEMPLMHVPSPVSDTCPACGRTRNPEWPFCPNCGHKF